MFPFGSGRNLFKLVSVRPDKITACALNLTLQAHIFLPLLIVPVSFFASPNNGHGCSADGQEFGEWWMLPPYAVTWVLASAASFMLRRQTSKHLKLCAVYSCLLLWEGQCVAWTRLLQCRCPLGELLHVVATEALLYGGIVTFSLAFLVSEVIFYARIVSMEESMQKDLGSRLVRRLLKLQVFTCVLGLVLQALPFLSRAYRHYGQLHPVLDSAALFANLAVTLMITCTFCAALACMGICTWAFLQPVRAVQRSGQFTASRKVRQATRTARVQLLSILVWTVTSVLTVLSHFLVVFTPLREQLYMLGSTLDLLCNVTGLLIFSGALEASPHASEDRGRHRRHARFRAAWRPDASAQWQEQVDALGERGISVAALLDFYEALPERMPHFDAALHSTRDVVFGAIIPASSEEGRSCAEVLMRGTPKREAGVMVTHVWSGLFADLIAAIVAHALNEGFSSLVKELLTSNIGALRSLVSGAGRLEEVYWVCAFSVNQHRSICVNCRCGLEKCLNSTPPLTADGRGIPCEMNKFGSMMAQLWKRNRRFQHLIVVDGSCRIFTRAWCMMECFEGYAAGMPQAICVKSAEHFSSNLSSLAQTRVEDMRASRPEDVEEILATIPDKQAFNSALQHIIFGKSGLLGQWLAGDAAAKLTQISWLARWIQVAEVSMPSLLPLIEDRMAGVSMGLQETVEV